MRKGEAEHDGGHGKAVTSQRLAVASHGLETRGITMIQNTSDGRQAGSNML
jgi:hypothetical protein